MPCHRPAISRIPSGGLGSAGGGDKKRERWAATTLDTGAPPPATGPLLLRRGRSRVRNGLPPLSRSGFSLRNGLPPLLRRWLPQPARTDLRDRNGLLRLPHNGLLPLSRTGFSQLLSGVGVSATCAGPTEFCRIDLIQRLAHIVNQGSHSGTRATGICNTNSPEAGQKCKKVFKFSYILDRHSWIDTRGPSLICILDKQGRGGKRQKKA